jgi:hypothetical protein
MLRTPPAAPHKECAGCAENATQGDSYERLRQHTEHWVATYARPHWHKLEQHNAEKPRPLIELGGAPARQVINDLGTQLSSLLQESRGRHKGDLTPKHITHTWTVYLLDATHVPHESTHSSTTMWVSRRDVDTILSLDKPGATTQNVLDTIPTHHVLM